MVKTGFGWSLLALSVLLSGCATPGDMPQSVLHSRLTTIQKNNRELPSDITHSWWQMTRENLQKDEYRITPVKSATRFQSCTHQAPNRANNLRTWFSAGGIHVTPRVAEERTAWSWGLQLVGHGRGDTFHSGASGVLRVAGHRAESARDGLTEWYINDRNGLEHGFTLDQRPGVEKTDRPLPLLIHMRVLGELKGQVSADRNSVDFFSADGTKILSYGGLKVFDADGKALSAALRLAKNNLTIEVDESTARYPVTIDPLLTTPSWIAEGDQEYANFGWSVASAGDVNGDGYDDVVVGAYRYDNGQADEGCAFVYHGSATGLVTTPAWTAESDQQDARFGWSVASAGDINGDGFADVIVGSPWYDNGQNQEGRSYLYHGSATGLSPTPSWITESDQDGAWFGNSVASAGDVNGDGFDDVIVGAPYFPQGYVGRAFVFHGSAAGLSTVPDWSGQDVYQSALFGFSVASAGDVDGDGFDDIIIGGLQYSVGLLNYAGRAYLYHGSGAGLSVAPNWTAEGDQENAGFGHSVASAGDVNGDGYSDVIIGAYNYDNGQTDAGRAYIYHGSDTGLSGTPDWTGEGDQESARFGYSVASAGDVNGDGFGDVIIGAPWFSSGIQPEEGRAQVYHGSSTGLNTVPAWAAQEGIGYTYFSYSVASAGDVNGDGYSDVIIGAYQDEQGRTNEGRAYVYYGGADEEMPPSAPVMSYSTDGLNLNLSWTEVSGASGYRLCYTPPPYTGPADFTCVDMNSQTGLSVTLWEGAALYVAVQAYNAQGNSACSNVEQIVIVSNPPTAPVLSHEVNGLNLTVNWTSVSGATGYRFYFAPNPCPGPESIGSIDMTGATSLSITLWEGAAFHIAVQAYNAEGSSDFSNVETFIIPR